MPWEDKGIASAETRARMSEAAKKRLPKLCSLYGFTPEFVKSQREAGFKWCSDCKKWHKSGKRRCSECWKIINKRDYDARPEYHRTRRQEARKANPEHARKVDRAQAFRAMGITEEEYDRLLAEQNGGCAICGMPQQGRRRFNIDHNHECCTKGSCNRCRRGLLCDRCNLHLFWLECPWYGKALAYLARYPLDGASPVQFA